VSASIANWSYSAERASVPRKRSPPHKRAGRYFGLADCVPMAPELRRHSGLVFGDPTTDIRATAAIVAVRRRAGCATNARE
jgi:hypothetical protein